VIVDSVYDWARFHNAPEKNPFRVAMAGIGDGRPVITLLRHITTDNRDSILPAMEMRGFQVKELREPAAFLEHLILHEAAHLLLPDGASESQCDKWAFEQMAGRIEIVA
jgi:hypothetical protein